MAWHFDQQPSWDWNHGMDYTHHHPATSGVDWRPTAEANEPTPLLSPNDGPSLPTYLTPTPSGSDFAFRGPSSRNGAMRQTTSLGLRDQPAAITGLSSPGDAFANDSGLPSLGEMRVTVDGTSPQRRNPRTQSQRNDRTADFQATTPLQCKWEGCRYVGGFQRVSELIRHIRNLHINPHAYPCPVPYCDKICNREDNLLQHMRTRHQLR